MIRLLMHPVFLLTLGGALGTNARYWLGEWIGRQSWAQLFPWKTVLVNVSGSLLLGFVAAWAKDRISPEQKQLFLLVGVGFCGGYTTFSTFSLETLKLVENGRGWLALGNVLVSVVAGLAAVWVGIRLARS